MSESKFSDQMLKVEPVEEYPTEPGCYLQGSHYSPVAVAIALNALWECATKDQSHSPGG